jgi:uncharacterized Zn finger protein (UPF0148 family)
MLKIYCPECGAPTEYSMHKPKFCSSCGYSFFNGKNQTISANTKPIVKESKIIENEDYFEEGEDEVNSVPSINNLAFDVEIQSENKEKLGKIMGSSAGGENLLRKNRINEKIDKKRVLEDFAREAGAIKPSTRTASQSIRNRKGKKDG